MKSAEIFAAGYAVPMYDISHEVRLWRFRDEQFELSANAVPLLTVEGIPFQVAKIDAVRAANG